MIIDRLQKDGLIAPPKWLPANTHYLTQMGSIAYAVHTPESDIDVVGFAIPAKTEVFPHLAGHIEGFGAPRNPFSSWAQHHVQPPGGQEYDFTVYSIIKFFQLCLENNPNMIDTLFTPRRCVLHASNIGNYVLENRRLFLHKGSCRKFRGYAFSQLAKIRSKTASQNPKRQASIDAHGYDVKFAYHVVRLALEAEQILTEHDLNLEANAPILRDIRAGNWSLDHLEKWFEVKEIALEELLGKSDLRATPDEDAIRTVLLNALEMHYGTISQAIARETNVERVLSEMRAVIDRHAA
ncbi:hypothetical protein CcrC1_gp105 [Caulobacter phage C1]|nr:hypothetical protein CcrC1_gp105 [Caulobacter phage C1]UTU08333.1 hypothetical protein CcrC2_gp105 [Caulobacter phage C2]UTU08853.1 hypothetical protein CcrJ4_gp102 [Caulobacter phage J4]UTU09407.1 hypothetical protein CcrBL47_gp121 [Caulobacter phage BL47]UTU09967.1 hypothetical protein CcrRB23_gp105 [Caulobacter phage RB23]WGN96992.1 hypothetical protein [Bertelyvirus sp.]